MTILIWIIRIGIFAYLNIGNYWLYGFPRCIFIIQADSRLWSMVWLTLLVSFIIKCFTFVSRFDFLEKLSISLLFKLKKNPYSPDLILDHYQKQIFQYDHIKVLSFVHVHTLSKLTLRIWVTRSDSYLTWFCSCLATDFLSSFLLFSYALFRHSASQW